MNILHMKYAVEVARTGSLSRASETLLIAQPNLSRAIRDLESDLGITIFDRSARGMTLTLEGEEFIGYASRILGQIADVEDLYKGNAKRKQRFSISVPRAGYISDAFSRFSLSLRPGGAELFYKETNSDRAIRNILHSDYHLGIIRYAEQFEPYFQDMMQEKELEGTLVARFHYVLMMREDSPLASLPEIHFSDLAPLMEIAHGDPFVPSLPMTRVIKEELPEDLVSRRICVFERASQYELLARNPEAFMWVSPTPKDLLDRYGLVERSCPENTKMYRDVLIHRKGYHLTALEQRFLEELEVSRQKYLG